MSAFSVQVEELSVDLGGARVLERVSLVAEPGRVTGLVGPNGAGKTTLLRAISGSVAPVAGEVRIDGRPVRAMGSRERARLIASVAQVPAIPSGFPALEVVLMGRNPHLGLLQWEGKKDLEIALAAMELTRTREFADRAIETLSGGERQRVFVARALAQDASVLLLDEPTAHLDVGVQVSVMETIVDVMKAKSLTVLVAMHDLTLAAQYCDHIVVMTGGSIRAAGPPAAVLTASLVSATFQVDANVIENPAGGGPVVVLVRRSARR